MSFSTTWSRAALRSGQALRTPPTMQRTQGRARNARIEVFLEECCKGGLLGPQRVKARASFGCEEVVETVATLDRIDLVERPEGSYAIVGAGEHGNSSHEFHLHMDKVRRIEMHEDAGAPDGADATSRSARSTRFLTQDGDTLMSWQMAGGKEVAESNRAMPGTESLRSEEEEAWEQIREKYGGVQNIRP